MAVIDIMDGVSDSETATGVDFQSVLVKVVYQLRFEIVFVASLIFLWLFGLFAKRGVPSNRRSTKHKSLELPERRPAQKAWSAPTGPEGKSGAFLDGANSNRAAFGQKETSSLLQETPSSDKLTDALWLIPRLLHLCNGHAQRAVALFGAALTAGLDINAAPAEQKEELILALVTSMIRMGLMDDAMRLVKDFKKREVALSVGLHGSAVKLCTAKQNFKECLALSDAIADATNGKITDKSVWSCLLFCAIESKSFHRCANFFQQLKANGVPSQKDYWNMVRLGSVNSDWKVMIKLIQEMRQQGLEVDNVIYNTALATCVSAEQMDSARELLDEMNSVGGITDVITYNTLMKGYANHGCMDDCFNLFDIMKKRELAPSQVTYGILLDGCINNNQVDRAAHVFDMMTNEGCPMNTVLYTTLIKGFARDGKVEEAVRIYHQMGERGVMPDLITYSILLKANCDAGLMDTSLDLLGAMLKNNLKPDEVIFNNLLAGCAKQSNAELAKRLYHDMIQSSIRPSNATFSILIRLYSQCKLLDEAVDMLRTEPAKHRVEIEARLYSQLIQCCIRARQGRRVTEVYEMMLAQSAPTAATNGTMLSMCVKLNMFDTAVELIEMAAAKGLRGRVDPRDANMVLEGAVKKRKTCTAQSCAAAMKELGMRVDQALLSQAK